MATNKTCDICKKVITNKIHPASNSYIYVSPRWSKSHDYCLKCWINEANWPKIHKITKQNFYHDLFETPHPQVKAP